MAWRRILRPRRHGPGTAHSLFPRQPGAYLAGLLLVVGMLASMAWIDLPVAMGVRDFYNSYTEIAYFFKQLTKLGSSGWVLILTGAGALFVAATRWRRFPRKDRVRLTNLHADLSFIFFNVAISGILVWFAKGFLGRARPKLAEQLTHLYFDIGRFEAAYASFPSGHSTTIGALAMAMALLLPRWRWFWLLFGILGGFSRVIVWAHYPSDVFAGLLAGAGLTWLAARYLAQRGVMFRHRGNMLPQRVRVPVLPDEIVAQSSAARPRSRSAIKSETSSSPT